MAVDAVSAVVVALVLVLIVGRSIVLVEKS
jgi:hypothetical protein